MQDITNKYASGIEFNVIKNLLDEELLSQINRRRFDTSKIEITWNLLDDDIVKYQTELVFTITSLDEEIYTGKKIDSFSSWTYYDLNSIALEYDPLTSIIDSFFR